MFTTPCFIRKNTPELVYALKKLGYTTNSGQHFSQHEYLIAYKGTYLSEDEINDLYRENCIDCLDNEKLFLAIAALRDDSDYMQWFVVDDEHNWANRGWRRAKGSFFLSYIKDHPKDGVHKATVEELIEHFNHEQDIQAPGNL